MNCVAREGWVLVGGRSSRMGSDKALIAVLPGEPLVLRIASEVRKVCDVVSLLGDPAKYSGLGLNVIPDRFAGMGPLAGIEAALGNTNADRNLIVACDMPAVDAGMFELLFEAGGDCALPRYANGRVEPVCAVYHRRCHEVILKALESGIRKVTDALRTLDVRYVQVLNPEAFANLNTPAELEKYRNG